MSEERHDKMKYEVQFTLRINEDLYKKLCAIASDKERSINSQIIYIIKKYIEEYEKNNASKK